MATTRGNSPADPTLSATTTDEALGGLFVRSNVANPVEGTDINGTIVNDRTITLSITINGDTQTQSFTTNQSVDSTEPFSFTVDGGSGGRTGDEITGGSFNASNGELTLTREANTPIVIPGFTFTPRTDDEINTLADARIGEANIQDLNNVPALGTSGQILRVSPTDTTQTEWVNPDPATVSETSFTSTDTSIQIEQNGAQVNLEAQPIWTGNDGRGGTVDASTNVFATRVVLAEDTGLVLTRNATTGVVTIQAEGEPPAPAQRATFMAPAPTSAVGDVGVDVPAQTVTFTAPAGNTVETLAMVSVMDPSNMPVTGVTSMADGSQTATVTIPEGATNVPGMYQVSAEVTTENTQTMQTMTVTEMPVVNRFIPYFQSRSDIMSATSMGIMTFGDPNGFEGSITSIGGSGAILYYAVLGSLLPQANVFADSSAGFAPRISFVRSISVPFPDQARSYNVFRVNTGAGVTLDNFRSSF